MQKSGPVSLFFCFWREAPGGEGWRVLLACVLPVLGQAESEHAPAPVRAGPYGAATVRTPRRMQG